METQVPTTALIEQLYCAYRAPLLRRLYQMVGDGDVAEDLLQETFLKIVARPEQALAVEYKAAWLNRVATNVAHDHFRRQTRAGLAIKADNEDANLLDTLPASRPAEQPGSAELDEALDIRATLERLPAHKRLPLVLHYYQGYSLKEMAALMLTEAGTARSRLFRARDAFRKTHIYQHASLLEPGLETTGAQNWQN